MIKDYYGIEIDLSRDNNLTEFSKNLLRDYYMIENENSSQLNQEIQEESISNLNSLEKSEVEEGVKEHKFEENIEINYDESEAHSEAEENEISSDQFGDVSEEQTDNTNFTEPSVRRLSLFDNISSNISKESIDENEKTEPVITENTFEIDNAEKLETNESNDETEPEFNASNDESDEDFNQETEEELLDIPTFLRRQAN